LQGAERGASLTAASSGVAPQQDLRAVPSILRALIHGMSTCRSSGAACAAGGYSTRPAAGRDRRQPASSSPFILRSTPDAMPDGGSIEVKVRNISRAAIPAVEVGSYLKLSLSIPAMA